MTVSIDHPTMRPNYSKVWVGNLTYWFSYWTPIAFEGGGWPFTYRANDWSSTTGMHLATAKADRNHDTLVGPLSSEWFTRALAGAERGITAEEWWGDIAHANNSDYPYPWFV